MRLLRLLGAAAAVAFLASATPAADIVINEYWADDAFGDDAEYIELFGPGGASLAGLSVIVVDGDTGGETTSGNYRSVDLQVDLTGTLPVDGYYVLGAGTTPEVDLAISLGDLENGSLTIAIVATSDIEYTVEDPDELTQASVDAITANPVTDVVATVDNGDGDHTYFGAPVLGPNPAGFPWDTASRIPNGVDTDSTGDWQTQDNFGLAIELGDANDLLSSPGSENGAVEAVGGATLMQANASGTVVALGATGGTPSYDFIIKVPGLPAADGTLSDNGTPIASPLVSDYTVVAGHTLTYDPPSATYRDTASFEFAVEDSNGDVSANTAIHHLCVQDDTVVMTEVMHIPFGTDTVHEYIEVYNHGDSTVTLFALAGNLLDDSATPELTGNFAELPAKTIDPGEMKILAPKGTPGQDEEFRCDWSLQEDDIIRVDTNAWEGITRANSLVALYADEEGTRVLLDAIWIIEGSGFWFANSFEDGRSLAVNPAGLVIPPFAPPINSMDNDGDASLSALAWYLSGIGGDYYGAGVHESLGQGNWGSPGWVPTWLETDPTFAPCFFACCLPDGTCQELTSSACEEACGTWNSGMECGDVTCTVQTTGGCCTAFGDCFDVTECECDGLGGTYFGDLSTCDSVTCDDPTEVVINEIDYDTDNRDYMEFVELIGPPNFDLSGWTLEFYNGNGGAVYNTIDLTGVTIPADRFLVIGSPFVASADVVFADEFDNIQNGAPDGMVLCDGTTPVELISYEGSFDVVDPCGSTAGTVTLPDITVDDLSFPPVFLQKIPNGFDWTETRLGTAGESNAEVGACCDDTDCSMLTPQDCADEGAFFQGLGTDCSMGLCDDGGCITLAEARAMGTLVGVKTCDVVVTNTVSLVNPPNASFQIQDDSGAITVFGDSVSVIVPLGVSEGDLIDISGTIAEFSGLLELTDSSFDLPLEVDIIATGTTIPDPELLTVDDLQDGHPLAESRESTLATLECVIFEDAGGTFEGGSNYNVTNDGSVTVAEVRVSTSSLDLVGTTIPSGYVSITGNVGQFTNFGNDPPDSGYQLQPRSTADIGVCVDPPTGACCVGGTCTIETFVDCQDAGGVYQGNDTVCDPNPCTTGACCPALGGACQDGLSADQCADGTWFPEELCADITCPDPLAACCLPRGECVMLTEVDCGFLCGTWNTGETCETVSCTPDPNTGCCCLPYGATAIMTDCECTTAGGDFDGDDPDCTLTAPGCTGDPLVINEIRVDQPGSDDNEYFEVFGQSSTSMYGLAYVVIGDGPGGDGVIETAVSLATEVVPADGGYLVVEDTFTLDSLASAEMVLSSADNELNFENSDNVTHLLVFGFTGAVGDDLDADDDGTLDVVPWAGVIDCIALVDDPAGGNNFYCAETVGPDLFGSPGQVYRNGDAGTWSIGAFDPQYPSLQSCVEHGNPPGIPLEEHCLVLAEDTPGKSNELGPDPRLARIGDLVMTVSDPAPGARAVSVAIDCGDGPVPYPATSDGTFVEVTIDPPLADATCCTVTIDGIEASWAVIAHEGDVNRDGIVNTVDSSAIKARFGTSTDSLNFIWDPNADGIINSIDFSAIKARFGNSLPSCP